MRRAPEPHQRKPVDGTIHRDGDATPQWYLLRRVGAEDLRSRRGGLVRVEEVRGAEDLGVVVVGGATDAAQAAAAGEYRAVGEEDGDAVVVSRDAHGSHDGEGVGGRVEEFGVEDGGVIAEERGVVDAPDDEHFAVREDDAVVERTGVVSASDGCYIGCSVGSTEGNDMCVGGCIGIDVTGGTAYS